MWGAIAGAAASVVGSLFGGGSKKQETTTVNRVDYKRMVQDAEAAGFNPLTALRNGGAAGYSVSTGTTPATPLSARLANGVAGAANTFLANFDPFEDKQREMGFQVAEAQLANLNADTALKQRTGLGSVPTYTGGNTKRTMGAGVGHNQKFKSVADALPASAGAPQTPEVVKPELINPYSVKSGMHVDPNIPNASAKEERYGDDGPVSWINGTATWTADMRYNAERYFKDLYSQASRDEMIRKANGRVGWQIARDVVGGVWDNLRSFNPRENPPLLSPRKHKQ